MPNLFENLGQKSFETFIPKLFRNDKVRMEIRSVLGERAHLIFDAIADGRELSKDDANECHDIMLELVTNESEVVGEFTGLGSFDEFSIEIMGFQGVYWICAPEFDENGYFETKEQASELAEFNYEPYITNWKKAEAAGEIDE